MACICGGTMEILLFIGVLFSGTGFSVWLTSLVNKHNSQHQHCENHKEREQNATTVDLHCPTKGDS